MLSIFRSIADCKDALYIVAVEISEFLLPIKKLGEPVVVFHMREELVVVGFSLGTLVFLSFRKHTYRQDHKLIRITRKSILLLFKILTL